MNPLPGKQTLGETAYWVFVSFLYAFIAADIAGRFSDVSLKWSKYEQNSHYPGVKRKWWYVPAYSHLVLAGFVVGTSWLGWSQFVNDHLELFKMTKGVIASVSLLLIVDFAILTMYFTFTSVVNKSRLSGKYRGPWAPHSAHAGYWVCLIMIGYAIWDYFVYFLVPRMEAGHPGRANRLELWPEVFLAAAAAGILVLLRRDHRWKIIGVRIFLTLGIVGILYFLIPWRVDPDAAKCLWAMSWMSVFCASLMGTVFAFCLRHVRGYRPFCILTADVSLIALVLFYRALKQHPDHSATSQMWDLTTRPFGSWINEFAWIQLLVFLGLAILAGCFPRRVTPADLEENPIRWLKSWVKLPHHGPSCRTAISGSR